jgi:polysaccharide biosynthesis/export protein
MKTNTRVEPFGPKAYPTLDFNILRTAKAGMSIAVVSVLLISSVALARDPAHPQEGRPSQESAPPREGTTKPAVERSSPSVLVDPSEDYRIGPRDVIEIQVADAPELSITPQVTANGSFLMPYLGRIVAQGRTPEELAMFIADRLRGRYLKDPRITVVVKQYNSRSFFIQGAVRSPGVYQIESRASLYKLINLAGGLMENHGSSAFIIREVKPASVTEAGPKPPAEANSSDTQPEASTGVAPEQYEMFKANINGLLKGHFEQNVMIEPGDMVNIPPTDIFFVAGEVVAPGEFPLKPGTTLRQAISLARGTTFKAATSRAIIFREDQETGKRQEIKIDVGAVMKGKKEDVPLLANDIVMVPDSRLKSVGGTLLSAFGMSAAMRGVPGRY